MFFQQFVVSEFPQYVQNFTVEADVIYKNQSLDDLIDATSSVGQTNFWKSNAGISQYHGIVYGHNSDNIIAFL